MKQFKSPDEMAKHTEKVLEELKKKATKIISEEFLKDSNALAPFDNGFLIRSGIENSEPEKGILKWVTPYARKLYYNPQYNFSKDKNPNAGGRWADRAKAINKPKYRKIVNSIFKQVKK